MRVQAIEQKLAGRRQRRLVFFVSRRDRLPGRLEQTLDLTELLDNL
jgi:hypothetical protein